MKDQHIVICLRDKTEYNAATYVQVTRRRFSFEDATYTAKGVAPTRLAVVVKVPPVELDEDDYPVFKRACGDPW